MTIKYQLLDFQYQLLDFQYQLLDIINEPLPTQQQRRFRKIKKTNWTKKRYQKITSKSKKKKETLNKDLAEIYAPITKNQEKQTDIIKEGQKKYNYKQ